MIRFKTPVTTMHYTIPAREFKHLGFKYNTHGRGRYKTYTLPHELYNTISLITVFVRRKRVILDDWGSRTFEVVQQFKKQIKDNVTIFDGTYVNFLINKETGEIVDSAKQKAQEEKLYNEHRQNRTTDITDREFTTQLARAFSQKYPSRKSWREFTEEISEFTKIIKKLDELKISHSIRLPDA